MYTLVNSMKRLFRGRLARGFERASVSLFLRRRSEQNERASQTRHTALLHLPSSNLRPQCRDAWHSFGPQGNAIFASSACPALTPLMAHPILPELHYILGLRGPPSDRGDPSAVTRPATTCYWLDSCSGETKLQALGLVGAPHKATRCDTAMTHRVPKRRDGTRKVLPCGLLLHSRLLHQPHSQASTRCADSSPASCVCICVPPILAT